MAILQVPSTGLDWQLSYRVLYSTLSGGVTDIFECPDSASCYDINYKISSGGGGAGTILMQKASGNNADVTSGNIMWKDIGTAVAVDTVGNSGADYTPYYFRFVIAGTPAANDVVSVQLTFE